MLREELGDFSSVVCLKAIITGMEDILGEQATAIALTNAGRIRGRTVAAQLGARGDEALDDLVSLLRSALGPDGTRLCLLDSIERDGDGFVALTRETVCSAGEAPGAPRKCTYTLGVIWGALQELLGVKLRGAHTGSVLRGDDHDVFRFTAL